MPMLKYNAYYRHEHHMDETLGANYSVCQKKRAVNSKDRIEANVA